MSDDLLVIDDENANEEMEDVVVEDEEEETVYADQSDHNIVDNPDGTRTLYLQYPITLKLKKRDANATIENKEFKSLTFRRCSATDLKVVGSIEDEYEILFTLLERLVVGVPKPIIGRIDAIDLEGCQLTIEPFLSSAPKTGKKS